MNATIAVIIAAIIAVVGTASAVTVTYNGNAAVDMNGIEYGGAADGSAVTITIAPPVAVTEPVITEEPVVTEEPTYDNEVTSAGYGTAPNGEYGYIVVYADGPTVIVYGQDEDGRMRMGAINMPPFGTYNEQAVAMYVASQ